MSNIGQILAMSGQNVGSQIGSGYAGLGQNVQGMLTGIGGNIRKKRGEREAMKMLEQFKDDPQGLAKMAQQYGIQGNTELATVFQNAATAATGRQDKKTKAIAGRGTGELMALANNPKFNIFDPKQQTGYLRMADVYGVTREKAMEIAIKVVEEREGRTTDDKAPTYAKVGNEFKDENGNLFVVTEQRTSEGTQLLIKPVGHNEKQKGKLTSAGGSYGETAGEKLGRDVDTAGGTTEAEEFAKLRIEAVDSLPQIESTIYSTEQSLELLDQIRTGGFSTAIVRAAQKVLGVETKTEAKFNLEAGKQVLAGLNSFEGAISEGERNYLESLYQDLTRSEGANRGILEVMLDRAQRALRDASTRANSNTFDEYMTNRESYGAPVKEPNRRVSWEDMSRGS